MFWGITLDVGKRYTQTVEKSFHLSMAALGFNNAKTDAVTIMVEVEKAQFALCTLQPGKFPQQPLDIAFTEGEEITFFTEGNNEVHLTGYLIEEPEAVDIDSMEEFSMDSASESESNESNSKSEQEDEEDSSNEPATLQELLAGENAAEEESDDDWDPTKDNPTPRMKSKNTKKSPQSKQKVENVESNGLQQHMESNCEQQQDNLRSLFFSELPSDEDDSEDYVPNKKKKDHTPNKKKGKERKLKESKKTEDASSNVKPEKFKKPKLRTKVNTQ